MKKIQNGLFKAFSVTAYFAQLNLQWLLFTLLGLIFFGIGPASSTLIQFLHRYREDGTQYSFQQFWHSYRSQFKSTMLWGLLLVVLIATLGINLRIIVIFFKEQSWLSPIYTFCSLIILYLFLLSFLTFSKAQNTSFRDCLKASVFLAFRFPLQGLALIFTCYLILLLLGAKTSLLLIFGASLLFFSADYFHSRMIQKMQKIATK